ncbi:Cilia- and flagella-associated protein 45 like protein [Aduncisulcus paluster]|nr:Cilia- and flagella-associated protein 45 like protein [Aduncisulcus paluster]|eukprot:gnl/Carplike_NY0171/1704_a2298_727.p1 GENE.gnl/Carplike_NY0171/1704_a2298_727~~gnl/Carplike_NY0171/1704_a2298_727.p1  ORF type:complete len:510 (+),score=209.35 gnl/Carplike_NY0171/1704_a2298_727:37-1566(+)
MAHTVRRGIYHPTSDSSSAADATLFGQRPRYKARWMAMEGKNKKDAAIIDASTLTALTGTPITSSTISGSEFQRIVSNANTGKDKSETIGASAHGQTLDTTKTRKSRAEMQRTRIQGLEKTRRQKLPPSSFQREKLAEREKMKAEVKLRRAEDDDNVKLLRSMAARAKALSEREKQLAEKKAITAKLAAVDSIYDEKAEKERQALLRETREKEILMAQTKRLYRQELDEQVKEHELQALIKEEELEQEKESIKREIESQRKARELAASQKEQLRRQHQVERIQADRLAATLKKREQERLRAEEKRILDFQRRKAEREEMEEKAKRDAAVAKELECAKLRAQQQRAVDTNAIEDHKRMLRAFELKEAKARREEIAKRKKAEKDKQQLRQNLAAQVEFKKQRKELELAAEKEYGMTIRKKVKVAEQIEKEAQETKLRANIEYKRCLDEQMVERFGIEDEAIAKEREGIDADAERKRLEMYARIKADTIAQLKKDGVSEKYLVDIRKLSGNV